MHLWISCEGIFQEFLIRVVIERRFPRHWILAFLSCWGLIFWVYAFGYEEVPEALFWIGG